MQSLIGKDLCGQRLTGNLEGIDISRTYAHYARIEDANCRGMMARQAELRGSLWSNVEAPFARLTMSDLAGAALKDCQLPGADLSGLFAKGAIFYKCDFKETTWEGAYLHGAAFLNCDLSGAKFHRAQLSGATFQDNKMHLTDFYLAEIKDFYLGQNDTRNIIGLTSDLELLKRVSGRIIGYRFQKAEDSPFHGCQYELGQEYEVENFSTDPAIGCAAGLHTATLDWCIACGIEEIGLNEDGRPKFKILEISCDPADIVTPFENGRFRARKMRFERELSLDEWWDLNETTLRKTGV